MYGTCSGPDLCPVCVAQRLAPEEHAFREAETMREEIQQAQADDATTEGGDAREVRYFSIRA